mmetsp:Transcript_38941/g.37271  ORF Transcript_38941/g.37271 Transcript_38941/m.37271 type:complete len:120 (+) Transcript_38941:51-410(+)
MSKALLGLLLTISVVAAHNHLADEQPPEDMSALWDDVSDMTMLGQAYWRGIQEGFYSKFPEQFSFDERCLAPWVVNDLVPLAEFLVSTVSPPFMTITLEDMKEAMDNLLTLVFELDEYC